METMTYEEYDKLDGYTASNLADFAKFDKNQPPPKKGADYFTFGNRTEECLRMRSDKDYVETFQVMPDGPTMPDDFPGIIDLLKGGYNIGDLYERTKKGLLDGRYKARHFWLDAIKDGVIDLYRPAISQSDQEIIDVMLDKLVAMPLFDKTVDEYLHTAHWSVPYQWHGDGVDKKCLFDIVFETMINDKPTLVALDLKSSASQSTFNTMWKSRYIYQDRHYTEGLSVMASELNLETIPYLVFIVAQKEIPYLPYVAHIDKFDIEKGDRKYLDNLLRFIDWETEEFEPTNHLPLKTLKVYYND